jgi:hypothetical protein
MPRFLRICFLILFFAPCINLSAMEWPLPDAVLIHNFGYNDRGRPVSGMVFEGEGEILAADSGEIIFSSSGKEFASRIPSPLGSWSAIDHGDGLVSIYGRYAKESENYYASEIEQGAPVARAGSSGWSNRKGVYFSLYDRRERRWVNASMVIPPLPDTSPPQIVGVQLRNADGRTLEGARLRNVSQGRYTILVNVFDTLSETRRVPLSPHRIACSVNGTEAGSLSFETICARDGMLMVTRNGLIPALKAYAHYPAFEAGEVHLSRGQAILEIIAHDIAGNFRSTSIRMIVE